MQTLNTNATKIFAQLLDKCSKQEEVQLKSEGYMPLTVERLHTGIRTAIGEATQYSLAHYYQQNGDQMRDPEMCFLVVDNRKFPEDYGALAVIAQMYQQDNMDIYEESISINNNEVSSVRPKWQKAHTAFANQWLRNIKAQGFLK